MSIITTPTPAQVAPAAFPPPPTPHPLTDAAQAPRLPRQDPGVAEQQALDALEQIERRRSGDDDEDGGFIASMRAMRLLAKGGG